MTGNASFRLANTTVLSVCAVDAPVVMTSAAFDVADAVGRLHDVLGQLRAFGEDGLEDVGRGVCKARKIVVALVAKHVVKNEKRVFDGRLVDRHAHVPPDAIFAERQRGRKPDDHDVAYQTLTFA